MRSILYAYRIFTPSSYPCGGDNVKQARICGCNRSAGTEPRRSSGSALCQAQRPLHRAACIVPLSERTSLCRPGMNMYRGHSKAQGHAVVRSSVDHREPHGDCACRRWRYKMTKGWRLLHEIDTPPQQSYSPTQAHDLPWSFLPIWTTHQRSPSWTIRTNPASLTWTLKMIINTKSKWSRMKSRSPSKHSLTATPITWVKSLRDTRTLPCGKPPRPLRRRVYFVSL
jgi:hypothetical protein